LFGSPSVPRDARGRNRVGGRLCSECTNEGKPAVRWCNKSIGWARAGRVILSSARC